MVKTIVVTALTCAATSLASAGQTPVALRSPDNHIAVTVRQVDGRLTYAIARDGKPVLLASDLGLQLAGADLTDDLTLMATSAPRIVEDHYQMAVGKRKDITYRANEQTWSLQNKKQQKIEIV